MASSNNYLQLFVATTFVILSLASASSSANINEVNFANMLVDDFLFNVSSKLDEKFEPILLPDKGFSFEKKILLATIRGEAKLTQGWLAGFSTLHRNGDARLMGSPGTVILKAPLGVSNLAGHYHGSVKFMNLGPTIDIDIKLGQVSVHMYLMQLEDEPIARLGSLKVVHVGQIEHKVKGLGLLDWILTPLNKFLVNALKTFIWGFLEETVKTWLAEQISLGRIRLPPVDWS